MKDKLLYSVIFSSFSYGFYRQWNCNYKQPNDLKTKKILLSTLNGVIYILPPICVFSYIRLLNRFEIKMTGKEPTEYPDEYEEFLGKNDWTI
jgi:hypothetical protein